MWIDRQHTVICDCTCPVVSCQTVVSPVDPFGAMAFPCVVSALLCVYKFSIWIQQFESHRISPTLSFKLWVLSSHWLAQLISFCAKILDGASNGSDSKKLRVEEAPPSRVLHIRKLPNEASETEVIALGLPFGKVTNILTLKGKNQVSGGSGWTKCICKKHKTNVRLQFYTAHIVS